MPGRGILNVHGLLGCYLWAVPMLGGITKSGCVHTCPQTGSEVTRGVLPKCSCPTSGCLPFLRQKMDEGLREECVQGLEAVGDVMGQWS